MIYVIVVSLFAYLLGSVNTAVILSKKFYKTDIRNHGSGNAGATNISRTFGKKAGAVIFFLDFSKGLIAVAAAKCLALLLNAPYECLYFAGFFAQLGHTFPVFFKFKGGKGVATAAGAAFGIMPVAALILLAVFALIVAASKTVSLASGICAVLYPLIAYFSGGERGEYHFIFAAVCAIMIVIKHVPNIIRILDGTENKISSDKKRTD